MMSDSLSDPRELLRALVHDLRSPLNQLQAFTDLLCRKYTDALPQEGKEFSGYIQAAAKRAAAVVERLDVYSRVLDPPLFEEVDLNAEVDSVLSGFPEGAVWREDLGSVSGDSRMIRRLFKELIENGLKFNRAARPAVRILREGGCISVVDNGIGIPAEMAERAFAPMRRLNGFEFDGAGMGLPICRQIVEAHKGRIWLETSDAGGLAVRVELFPFAPRE